MWTLSLFIVLHMTSSFAVMIIIVATRGRAFVRNMNMDCNKLIVDRLYPITP